MKPRLSIVTAAAMLLAISLAGCSRDEQAGDGRASTEAGPTGTTGVGGQGEGQAGAPGDSGSRAPAGAGGRPGGGQQPASPIIDVRGTVASVDRAAGLIRLTAPDAGYSVIEVTPSTEYRLSEGESATFAEVVPGAVVVGTGLGQDGRLRSRLVTILSY